MITNIIDRRTNEYKTKCYVVVEDSHHDHHINIPTVPNDDVIMYDDFVSVNICDVINHLATQMDTLHCFFMMKKKAKTKKEPK